MDRHYVPDLASAARPGSEIVLRGPEAHHLARVKRARSGDEVLLFDGCGTESWARIERIDRTCVCLRVLDRPTPRLRSPCRMRLALAAPERKRLLWAIEKATELGAEEILVLDTARSQERVGAVDRLRSRALEAAKQSGVLCVPSVATGWSLARLCEGIVKERGRIHWLALDPRASAPFSKALSVADSTPEGFGVIVGPPGGLRSDELERLETSGAVRARLGSTVLRTETAAVAALALVVAHAEAGAV